MPFTKLDDVTTTITDGSASISVSFELDKTNEETLNEVRKAVDSAKANHFCCGRLPSCRRWMTPRELRVTGSDG